MNTVNDTYAEYLERWTQARETEWADFQVAVEEGHSDPLTFEEFCAQDEPVSFDTWVAERADMAREQAEYEKFPEGW